MIVFERFGHIFKIRNDDWKNFRARYSLRNAEYDSVSEDWKIVEDCTLCMRHASCKTCPFGVLNVGRKVGCVIFIEKIFRKPRFNSTDIPYVSWEAKDNASVRRQLKRMQEIMDEIEKENQRKKGGRG